LNSLNQKNTLPLLILLVSILALTITYFYVVSPMLSKKSAKEMEVVQKQQELTTLQQQLMKMNPTGSKEIVQLSQVRRKIPETDQVESLVRDMRMLETMEVPNVVATPTSTATAVTPNISALVQTIKFNQAVKGDYGQIIRFLEEIQTSERLMTIDKITFNMTTSPPVKINIDKKQIVCTLSINAYFSPGLQKFFKVKTPIYYNQPEGRVYPLY
jgi:Tfp pilus assembly protein PilO